MSKRLLLLTATAFAAFGLTACGNNAPPAAPHHDQAEIVPITPPAAAAPPSGTPTYLAKRVGERAGITNRDGSEAVDFWITKISVDPKCDPYSQHEAGGRHTVVLDVTVKTYTDKIAGQRLSPFKVLPGTINPFSLSTAGSTGVTRRIETDRCVTTPKKLPSTYAPGHAYTGQIAFATPYKSGKVQVTQSSGYFQNSTLGWEWSY
ncbi:hypothetical protein ABZU76_44120 [Amycolatopsis sp. NPDC005232]|uniref:hypothetical protein n=1 Tax=Amycolatopsis sp. NPDC005232 TaxID=3157027 RepID=UPI0033AB4A7F